MIKNYCLFFQNMTEKIFAWLEGESPPRPKRERKTSEDHNGGTKVSNRRMVPPSNEIQIPDPWD